MITDFSSINSWALTDLFLWVCWNWLFSWSPSTLALRAAHSGLPGNTGMFRLKLLISFLSLSIAWSNWLARLGRSTQDRPSLRWSQADLQLHRADPFGLLVCLGTGQIFVPTAPLWDGILVKLTSHNGHGGLQQQRHPYGTLRRPIWWR